MLNYFQTFVVCFFLLFIGHCKNINYVNMDLIQTSLNIAQMTYCENIRYTYDDEFSENSIYANNTIIEVIENRGVLAIVGFNSLYKSIFVAYRGSENIVNWINNMKMTFVYPYDIEIYKDIGIQKGFYTTYSNVYDEVIDAVSSAAKKYDVNDVILSGHSLGSISSILALDIHIYTPSLNVISVTTFGSPRFGNDAFNDMLAKLNMSIYRITHNNDIVPHILPYIFGYRHSINQLWFNNDNSAYIICDGVEDPECFSSCGNYSCLNVDDHMNYMNVSMGSSGDCN